MGKAKCDDATAWERRVLRAERLSAWRVERTAHDGYAWLRDRRIQTSKDPALFLHEVAHALRARAKTTLQSPVPHGDKHDGWWASIYTRLVGKWMKPKA